MYSHIIIKPYKMLSINFLKAYLITMRPYLLFVSGNTGIAGISFSQSTNNIQVILIFIAAFLSYGFGQALTDCFQIDTDSISSPYRPLTQGVVSRKIFLLVSLTGLTFCIAIFSYFNIYNLLLGIAAGIGLATYTYFKRRWWGGPFYNSWIVGILFLMAYSAAANANVIFSTKIYLTIAAVFCGYANFVLSGYFKDISADKETGYNTLLVVYGRKVSSRVSDVFAALFIVFSFLVIEDSLSLLSFIFFSIGLILTFTAQYKLKKIRFDEESHSAISLVVHSYILILSSIALSQQPDWWLQLIIFYISFNLVMKLRPAKEQI